ncbi:MAG: pyridoxamine 5'-phosphate oxidase family protein [Cyanobacteria bacterium P01_D01_bin.1]
MAKQYKQITTQLHKFIKQQKVFFVGTAAKEGRVNVSPKGMDSLRIFGPNRVVWLSVTGSGNETAAHLAANSAENGATDGTSSGRMTIMFCAFEGAPTILRLYGTARAVYPRDDSWAELIKHFTLLPGTRQLFDLSVDLVQTSCGMAVPLYDYQADRESLIEWAQKKEPEGIEAYQREKNQVSIDGLPTAMPSSGS